MTVHLVYRSYGGENIKSRPPWFSKLLSAASFARAAQEAGLRPLWLNDGPVPQDRMDLFTATGDVMTIAGGPVGMRKSYVTGLRLAVTSDWDDDDIVYFCEDDYLHAPDAITALQSIEARPEVSYVALHGASPRFANLQEYPRGYTYPRGWTLRPDIEAGGHRWSHVVSTASTFGARVGALRADYRLFRQAMVPFRRRYLDHETCLMYQGQVPYHGMEYLSGSYGDFVPGVRGVVRAAALLPFRVGMTVSSRRNAGNPHLLYAAVPNLACHVEFGVMNPGRDWDALAADTRTWALDRGIPVRPLSSVGTGTSVPGAA